MATRILPTPERLRELLTYDPETGRLFWKERPVTEFPTDFHGRTWNKRFSGKEALISISTKGYRYGGVLGQKIVAHRVAWAMHFGEWPEKQIDHINCVKTDNRICNLRQVTGSSNQMNRGKPRDNKSGFKGVSWNTRDKKWVASIGFNGKQKILGRFSCPEKAYEAYKSAAIQYHGEYVNFT